MIADDNLVVILGPGRRGGEENGAAQRIRHQVRFIVFSIVAHEVYHGRYVVVCPFVNAAKPKALT